MAEKEKAVENIIKIPEIRYSVQELAQSGIFDCPPECVYAAFKEKNMLEASKEVALKIMKNFLVREVK